jgi:hypothetical protein
MMKDTACPIGRSSISEAAPFNAVWNHIYEAHYKKRIIYKKDKKYIAIIITA